MVSWPSYWGAIGVAELLVIGTLFFLFPEPVTSVLGMALIAVAAAVWVAGWYRGDRGDHDRTADRDRMDRDRTTTEERRVRR